MRKNVFLFFIIILLLSAFYSCTDRSIGPVYQPQSFSFWVDGSFKYAGELNYSFYSESAHSFTGTFYSKEITENYLSINLTDTAYLHTGTYMAGYDSATHTNLNMCYYSNDSHPYSSTSGSLTITQLDTVRNLLSGTFQFTGNYVGSIKHITYGTLDQVQFTKTH